MKSKYVGNPITKDQLNRKLSGVCAGVARHYNLPVWGTRLAVVIFGCLFPVFTVLGYLAATLLMSDRRY
ncbi:MAG: PspC domain-containing protein [Gammaproteobacteria bacterium]|nr:PspC domain-containing protein [Gammaproteobacteria bacterium]